MKLTKAEGDRIIEVVEAVRGKADVIIEVNEYVNRLRIRTARTENLRDGKASADGCRIST